MCRQLSLRINIIFMKARLNQCRLLFLSFLLPGILFVEVYIGIIFFPTFVHVLYQGGRGGCEWVNDIQWSAPRPLNQTPYLCCGTRRDEEYYKKRHEKEGREEEGENTWKGRKWSWVRGRDLVYWKIEGKDEDWEEKEEEEKSQLKQNFTDMWREDE